MVRHAHEFIGCELREVLAEELRGVDRQQQRVRPLRRRRPAVERGVEFEEFVRGHAGEFGSELQVDLVLDVDPREVRVVRDRAELEAEQGGVAHHALHRQELRHIGARLGGQPQVPESDRLAGGEVVAHGAADAALAAVVAGDGEQPVALELIVQVLQVIERGAGRFDDIASSVVPPGLGQSEAVAGAGDELPEPRGASARIGEGLEGALDHRQQRELHRHAALVDLFDDVVHVERGAPEHAVEVRRVAGVPERLVVDRGAIFVLELEARPDAVHEIGVRVARTVGADQGRGRRTGGRGRGGFAAGVGGRRAQHGGGRSGRRGRRGLGRFEATRGGSGVGQARASAERERAKHEGGKPDEGGPHSAGI